MSESTLLLAVASAAITSALAVRAVRMVALKKALVDIPNERSSHKLPVPRLGGAAFVPVVVLAGFLFAPQATLPGSLRGAVLIGGVALYTISLVDDFFTLSARLRFVFQFMAAGLVLWAGVNADSGATLGGASVAGAILTYGILVLWIVGLLNIYNFMDGIDGIAGLQAVVAGGAWCVFGLEFSAPFVAVLGCLVAGAALGFLTCNWPPAKIFMGDAGSTVLGFIFAALPLLLSREAVSAVPLSKSLAAGMLVVWPFLADGGLTILRRIRKRENIFKAHRSHLYQRLVIAGKSHRNVTLVYGGLAAIGGGLAWCVTCELPFAISISVGVIGVLFLILWRWTVLSEQRIETVAALREVISH